MQEIIRGFDQIAAKARTSGKSAEDSFAGFNKAIGTLKGILGTLGATASVAGIIAIGKEAANAAENMVLLGQRIGTTAQNIQALQVAAKMANVDLSASSRALATFLTNTTKAAAGVGTALKPLQALGFSMKEIRDLAGKDLAGRVDALAVKFKQFPDGPEASAAMLAILGNRGLALIPMFRELGENGVEATKRRLSDLGVLIDDKVLGSVKRMNDDFKMLQFQMQGLAIQAVGGLAPALSQMVKATSDVLSKSGKSWTEFGQIVGDVLKGLAAVALQLAVIIGTVTKTLADAIGGAVSAGKKMLKGDFKGAMTEIVERNKLMLRDLQDGVERSKTLWTDLFGAPAKAAKHAKATGEIDPADLFDNTLAAQREAIDAEIQMVKELAKARESAESQSFESSLESLTTYYAHRRQIVQEETDAEIALLEKRRQVELSSGPSGAAQAVKTQGEIDRLRVESRRQIAESYGEESKAARALAAEKMDLDRRIAEARGDHHKAAMLQIEEEVEKARQLLAKTDLSPGEQQDELDRLREALSIQLKLKSSFGQAAVDSISNFFSTGIIGAKSFAQAIAAMAVSVVSSIAQIIAQIVALKIVGSIVGLFAGGASSAGTGSPVSTSPTRLPPMPPGYARGGVLGGVGSSTGDMNLAAFSPGEFLTRAAIVAQPGALGFLRDFNRVGMMALRSPVRRYAEGGQIGPAGASGRIDGRVTVGLERGLVLNELDSPNGDRLLVEMVARNRRALSRVLGG